MFNAKLYNYMYKTINIPYTVLKKPIKKENNDSYHPPIPSMIIIWDQRRARALWIIEPQFS